jgi:hypothetical protein
MRKDMLERPLLDFQAVDILSVHDWNMLVRATCEAAGMMAPSVRFDEVFAEIKRIQDGYMFWDVLNLYGEAFRGQGEELAYLARNGAIGLDENLAHVTVGSPSGLDPELGLRVPASKRDLVEVMSAFFAAHDIMSLSRIGMLNYGGEEFVSMRAKKGARFDILTEPSSILAADLKSAAR